MVAPTFFHSDSRRADLAWTDWDGVRAFIERQHVCRIAVNDDAWPYVLGLAYRFTGDAFELNFSRRGKLASALARDAHCTIEIDEPLRIASGVGAETLNADYRSVIARCRAELREIQIGAGRTIVEARAVIVTLSAKHRGTSGAEA